MGGFRQTTVALLAVALVTALVPAAPTAQANQDGCGSSGCELTRAFTGDHWAAEIDVAEETTVEAGSTIEVSLSFDDRTDQTGFFVAIEDLDNDRIPLGVVVWVKATRDRVQVHHEPIASGPVDVDVAPLGELAWDEISATIRWNVDQTFQEGTHRLVAAGPTADNFAIDLSLDSDATFTLGPESDGSTAPGGGLVTEADWDPATMVQAPQFKLLEDGQATIDVPAGERLYGYYGPATGGAAAVDACFLTPGGVCGAVAGATGTNYGYSAYSLERPDGQVENREASWPVCTFSTCPGGPSQGTAFAFVDEPDGTWTMNVDEHVGVGTAPNMVAIAAPVDLP